MRPSQQQPAAHTRASAPLRGAGAPESPAGANIAVLEKKKENENVSILTNSLFLSARGAAAQLSSFSTSATPCRIQIDKCSLVERFAVKTQPTPMAFRRSGVT